MKQMRMETIAVKFGNWVMDGGFTSIPNVLLRHHVKLNVSEDELLFLVKLLSFSETWKIHDTNDIFGKLCSKTIQRRRVSLRKKGLLTYEIHNVRKADGTFKCDGVTYDLSQLFKRLEVLSDRIERDKDAKVRTQAITEGTE